MGTFTHDKDAKLVSSLQKGSHEAFSIIYRKYAKDLFRYARHNIDVTEDCQGLVQEVFESLWLRHQQVQITSLRHYLLTSMRYRIASYFKHEKVKQKYAQYYNRFEVAYETSEKEEGFDPEAVHEMITQRIEDLPERCQMVIRLRIDENLSHAEIAKRMSISRKTVEMQMTKAFKHFRESYKKLFRSE